MKKHMTLEQLFDVYDAPISVFRGTVKVERERYAEYMKLPVMRIERYPDDIVAYVGAEKEKDDYDLTPTKENMKSILDEAFGDWYESRRNDVVQEIVASGEWDDEVIERCLADTEWKSIDEMTEYINELRDKVECRQEALEEIFQYAREYAD